MQHKQTCGMRVSVQQQQQQPQPMTHQQTQQQPPHQQQHVQHNTYQQQQVFFLKGVLKVRRKYWSIWEKILFIPDTNILTRKKY